MIDGIAKLKTQSGGPILVTGSVALVRSLLRDDLLDELRLITDPIVLGGGTRLFDDTFSRTHLMLRDARSFDTGTVSLTYGVSTR